jgi:hypothetical protein
MARNRSSAKKNAAKKRRLELASLPKNCIATLDESGQVQIRSTDKRPAENYGVVSALGRDLRRLFILSPPYLSSIDAAYLTRESLPKFADRQEGVCLF